MTVTYTSMATSYPGGNTNTIAQAHLDIVNAFVAAGGANHTIIDTVVVNTAERYSIVQCVINDLNNAYSTCCLQIYTHAASNGIYFRLQLWETWNPVTHTGTNGSGFYGSGGGGGAVMPGSNGFTPYNLVFQIFSSPEIRAVAISLNGSYSQTYGILVPSDVPSTYSRNNYNYVIVISNEFTGTSGVFPNTFYLPARNPWSPNLPVIFITPTTLDRRDSVSLNVPIMRGAHIYNAAQGAVIGGMSSDWALMPRSPITTAGDRVIDVTSGEIHRPVTQSNTTLNYACRTDV